MIHEILTPAEYPRMVSIETRRIHLQAFNWLLESIWFMLLVNLVAYQWLVDDFRDVLCSSYLGKWLNHWVGIRNHLVAIFGSEDELRKWTVLFLQNGKDLQVSSTHGSGICRCPNCCTWNKLLFPNHHVWCLLSGFMVSYVILQYLMLSFKGAFQVETLW